MKLLRKQPFRLTGGCTLLSFDAFSWCSFLLCSFHMTTFLFDSLLSKRSSFAPFSAKKTPFQVSSHCLATSYSHRGKPPTTIGAKELNDRVRHGNGCDLFAIATRLWFTSDKRRAFLSVSSFLFSHVREYAPSSPSSLPQIPCFSL